MRQGYKETKLGIIPNDWEVIELSEVSSKIGDGIHSTPKYIESSSFHFVNGNNLINGKLTISNKTKCVSKEEYEKLKIELKENSILMSINGTIGNLAFYKNEEVIFGKSAAFITVNDSKLNHKYLYYFLQTSFLKKFYYNQVTGTTIKNLSLKSIRSTPVFLPSIEEQQKIANILSAVDAKIDLIDQQISETQTLKKGLMQQLLTKGIGHTEFKESPLGEIPKGWEVLKLSDICDEIFLGLTSKVDYVEQGGYPFIRATDINTGKLRFDNVKHISKTQHEKLTRKRLTKKGDVLVSKSGTLGTCAIVDVDIEFSTYESIITIQPKLGLLSNKFLLQILQDTNVQKRMIGTRVGGIVGHLNLKTFRKLTIPLPKIEEQNQISELLSIIDDKLEILSEKKKTYQELKKGLMQQLLTGKVRTST